MEKPHRLSSLQNRVGQRGASYKDEDIVNALWKHKEVGCLTNQLAQSYELS